MPPLRLAAAPSSHTATPIHADATLLLNAGPSADGRTTGARANARPTHLHCAPGQSTLDSSLCEHWLTADAARRLGRYPASDLHARREGHPSISPFRPICTDPSWPAHRRTASCVNMPVAIGSKRCAIPFTTPAPPLGHRIGRSVDHGHSDDCLPFQICKGG